MIALYSILINVGTNIYKFLLPKTTFDVFYYSKKNNIIYMFNFIIRCHKLLMLQKHHKPYLFVEKKTIFGQINEKYITKI